MTTTRSDLAQRLTAVSDDGLVELLLDLDERPGVPSRDIKITACGEEIMRRPFSSMLASGEVATSAVDVGWALARWKWFVEGTR